MEKTNEQKTEKTITKKNFYKKHCSTEFNIQY